MHRQRLDQRCHQTHPSRGHHGIKQTKHTKYLNTIIAFFLTLNGWTYHTDRSQYWNERNNLTGIEYDIGNGYSIEGILFINSFGDDGSTYGINKKWPINTRIGGPGREYFSLKSGSVDGYDGGPYFFVLPFYRREFERVTLEYTINPKLSILMVKVNF